MHQEAPQGTWLLLTLNLGSALSFPFGENGGLCFSGGLWSPCELGIFCLPVLIRPPSLPVLGPGRPTYMGGTVLRLPFELDQVEA